MARGQLQTIRWTLLTATIWGQLCSSPLWQVEIKPSVQPRMVRYPILLVMIPTFHLMEDLVSKVGVSADPTQLLWTLNS